MFPFNSSRFFFALPSPGTGHSMYRTKASAEGKVPSFLLKKKSKPRRDDDRPATGPTASSAPAAGGGFGSRPPPPPKDGRLHEGAVEMTREAEHLLRNVLKNRMEDGGDVEAAVFTPSSQRVKNRLLDEGFAEDDVAAALRSSEKFEEALSFIILHSTKKLPDKYRDRRDIDQERKAEKAQSMGCSVAASGGMSSNRGSSEQQVKVAPVKAKVQSPFMSLHVELNELGFEYVSPMIFFIFFHI